MGGLRRDGGRARAAGPAQRRPDPARAPRRRGGRRRSGARSRARSRRYFNVNEILSTIMLNLVAVQIDELPARRADGRHAGGLGRRADPADAAPARELAGCRSSARHAAAPRRARSPCWSRSPRTSCSGGRASASVSAPSGSRARRRPTPGCRCADDHARDDAERRDVRARRLDARLREHLAPHGHRREPDRLHRLGGLQRHRRRAVRRPEPAVDDPLVVRLRRPARRRRRDAGRRRTSRPT